MTGSAEHQPALAGIVIAAGASARLGQPKQLVPWRGEALVVRAARLALEVCTAGVTVVTGAGHDDVCDALEGLPASLLYNPRWREGMSASIRQGIVGVRGDSRGMLLMLVDQPLVDADDLSALVNAWSTAPEHIAASSYLGINGPPAIFPSAYRDSLLALRGDSGARDILRHSAELTLVDMPSAAIDIDSPHDLLRLHESAD